MFLFALLIKYICIFFICSSAGGISESSSEASLVRNVDIENLSAGTGVGVDQTHEEVVFNQDLSPSTAQTPAADANYVTRVLDVLVTLGRTCRRALRSVWFWLTAKLRAARTWITRNNE